MTGHDLDVLVRVVARTLRIREDDIRTPVGQVRDLEVIRARRFLVMLLRHRHKETLSLRKIAKLTGYSDHAAVCGVLRRAEKDMVTEDGRRVWAEILRALERLEAPPSAQQWDILNLPGLR